MGLSYINLACAILLWYVSSAMCTACAKLAFQKAAPLSCALSLTALQFVVSTVLCMLLWVGVGCRAPPRAIMKELLLVSLAYALGFTLLNQSLGRLAAAFMETVRGLEPLTSFVLARLFGGRGAALSGRSALALLAVLGGATLCIWAQPKFDLRGLALGLLANVMFSSRALLVTLMQDAWREHARAAGQLVELDGVSLFTVQHALGLLLVLPAALVFEGAECVASAAAQPEMLNAAMLSALGFFGYNLLSLFVLLLLNAVAHSVANTCRRAVTILTTAAFFSTAISALSGLGICLIICGAATYAFYSGQSTPSNSLRVCSGKCESDGLCDSETNRRTLPDGMPSSYEGEPTEETELTLSTEDCDGPADR